MSTRDSNTVDASTAPAAILAGRDARQAEVQRFTSQGHTVVTIVVNVPGADKNPSWAEGVLVQGFRQLRGTVDRRFGGALREVFRRERASGGEVILLVDAPPLELKKMAIAIEDGEAIGRLLDIDVHTAAADGLEVGCTISRFDLGLPGRRCLLCDAPAHECARSRRHSLEELKKKIAQLLEFANS
jgi:holo-ACP synthase CitX